MDPNACLAEIARLLGPSPTEDIIDRLEELCDALCGWLSRGGFEPDWERFHAARCYFENKSGFRVS